VWFTDSGTSKIGKITPAGVVTEYALPSGSQPYGITGGPDGNVWFTDNGTSELGRVTTAGVVTEYALPSGSRPNGITAGSDGNLWLADSGTNKISKISPTSLSEGALRPPQPGTTLEYGISLASPGLPSLTSTEVAKWGQQDAPVEGTAVVAADAPQGWPASSYQRATAYYLDGQGRLVNTATPSTASYGSVATTEYNETNDVIRTLSPDGRQASLEAGANSVAVSKLLDAESKYNGEGANEGAVEEPGTRLVESFGPEHEVKYTPNGSSGRQESLARLHTKYSYNEGAPGGEKYDLVTETSQLAELFNGEGKSG
jgi:hypothetical protein